MSEPAGHAPLLFTFLLGNQNNNGAANNNNVPSGGPIPGTAIPIEQVVEAKFLQTNGIPEPLKADVTRVRMESQIPKVLAKGQCEFYRLNGYFVLLNALTAEETTKLFKEAHAVTTRISEGGEGIIKHDASTEGIFISPINRVLATFEATSNTSFGGLLRRPIARMGCGIHQHLPSFRSLTHSKFHRSIAKSLDYENPCITQSQLIVKLAGVGSRIVPHQDGAVSFTNPPSGLTFWYALEDATLENGCLDVAAGSHRTEPLRQRLTKGPDGKANFVDLEAPLWARGVPSKGAEARDAVYEYTPLEVKKGTLVLFHGNLMHRSGRNRSEKNRMAYTFSIVDGTLECPDDTYMKPAGGTFDVL